MVVRKHPLPKVLYHGTSSLYLEQILEQGLLPSNVTGAVAMTCLTDDFALARHHAECMAEWEEADAIVFSIPTDRLDESAFTLEDNFVRIGPSGGRGAVVCEAIGIDAWQALPWNWLAMLRIAGVVGYVKPIPVAREDFVVVPMPDIQDEDDLGEDDLDAVA